MKKITTVPKRSEVYKDRYAQYTEGRIFGLSEHADS